MTLLTNDCLIAAAVGRVIFDADTKGAVGAASEDVEMGVTGMPAAEAHSAKSPPMEVVGVEACTSCSLTIGATLIIKKSARCALKTDECIDIRRLGSRDSSSKFSRFGRRSIISLRFLGSIGSSCQF